MNLQTEGLKTKPVGIHTVALGISTLISAASGFVLPTHAEPIRSEANSIVSTSGQSTPSVNIQTIKDILQQEQQRDRKPLPSPLPTISQTVSSSISSEKATTSSVPTSPSSVTPTQTETVPSTSVPKPANSSSKISQTQIAQTFPIKKIEVVGGSVFGTDKLDPIVKPLEGKEVTESQLTEAATAITQLYVSNGYVTSQAIFYPQNIANGIAKIQVYEGKVERIEVVGVTSLNPDYVRSRAELGIGIPLNTSKLEDQLRLLRTDPVFTSVEASLKPGSQTGSSILTIKVVEANQLTGFAGFDNFSAPAVGSERLGVGLNYRNLFGLGDVFSTSYYRTTTGGSNQYDFGFSIPVNPMNGTVSIRYAPSNYRITQSPFDAFNIRGNNEVYSATFRQPLIRTPREEFALSLGYEYQKGQTFLFNDLAVPFGLGPEADGTSRTSVFKFGQDYTNRDTEGVWSLRSQFSLGTGLFGATYVTDPSAAFFSWLGQIQRVQVLGSDTILIGALDAQFSADPLLPSQQFVIGGGQSVRGFRQNARSGDNGIRFSLESRFVVARNEEGRTIVQLAPFVDLGTVWNNGRNLNLLPNQNFLAGGGLGILVEPISRLNLRLDYAIPFVNLSDRGSNLQESSLYFSLGYQF
ncbi:ShlB/FhaC/HecB family hemolysin secretion/activation protein [Tumidithrix elongata RA019]|uniref:ShlB/FhaC/HecB family hemolysin secretion/activation protein n=1 Tax=Tumidithrix elongata BACA0141 TaxID=2716417 RepID=A0AAW9PWR9_9CYAN|nr:ShlB/FhaC/HecB family hemolysin secretion/activation protein [Tumidithrix elongata RA019]